MHCGDTLKISTKWLQGDTEGQHPCPAQQNSMSGDRNSLWSSPAEDLGDTRGVSLCTGVLWIAEPPQVGWILAHCSTCSIEQYLLKYIFFHFSGLPLFCADPTLSLEASTWKVFFSISQNWDMLNWHSKKMTIIWEQFISCSYRLTNAHFHATYRCVCISLFW